MQRNELPVGGGADSFGWAEVPFIDRLDERPYRVRLREREEHNYMAKRTALAAEAARLRLLRAEDMVDGVWAVGDTALENAEMQVAKVDQDWAENVASWDRVYDRRRRDEEADAAHRRMQAAADERANDPAFVAAVQAATEIEELEEMFRRTEG